ncbi:MAG: formylglycine-generating enzyme family protein [Opitutales bacterium]
MVPWSKLVSLSCIFILPLSLLGQVREWKDISGNRVRGEITARDGEIVTLRLENGESMAMPIDNLTESDRRIAFGWRPRQVNSKVIFGRPWIVPGTGLEMVWIKPGNYRRGSSVLEEGRAKDEALREVVLSRGFWLSKFELTQAQWASLMNSSPSRFSGKNRPVEHVSWEDANTFCLKMTKRERINGFLPQGFVYSLPSEAQWEYACRVGSTTAFGHGNEAGGLDKFAWTLENANGKTHEVGELRPNRWGLHDMHGNVLEWCRDRYGEYPKGKTIDPEGSLIGAKRVARGGSVTNPRMECRSAKRFKGEPEEKDMVGLRVALVPAPR